jgi:hypothetical protein
MVTAEWLQRNKKTFRKSPTPLLGGAQGFRETFFAAAFKELEVNGIIRSSATSLAADRGEVNFFKRGMGGEGSRCFFCPTHPFLSNSQSHRVGQVPHSQWRRCVKHRSPPGHKTSRSYPSRRWPEIESLPAGAGSSAP